MRVLVTGGAGFIGAHLCERLLESGDKVVCLDNFKTGSRDNVKHLRTDKSFEMVKKDLLDPLDFRIDRVFNLACPASPQRYQKDPIGTIKINTIGMIGLLELARRRKARILQASTSEVYGDPLAHPQSEDYWGNVNPIGPRSCYDEGKRIAESLMFAYGAQHRVDIRVARIFNTYGPRMGTDDGRVVSNFIVQALEGNDITVYGDGSQTRSFCYVSDMVEGLCRLMDAENFTGPVNLGNPAEITVLDLARKVKKMTGSASMIRFRPLPTDDPVRRRPDITLAKRKLGWKPKVDLDTGLRKTIDYFRTVLDRG
ncbi:MAG: SDR family oxidoreductase [Methanomassiliicoccales archaeon]|nr:SDR family oxidoreductase [Methanomassiliicoccales archaeon]